MNKQKEKTTLTLRIPQWVVKSIWRSLPLALVFTFIAYTIAITPIYSKMTQSSGGREWQNEDYFAGVPSFMGDSFRINPYRYIESSDINSIEKQYSNRKNVLGTPIEVSLFSRFRLACRALFSYKGLRFIVLMWVLSFGILWVYDHYRFSVKIISDNDKENTSQVEESIIPESDTSKKEESGREE